MDALEAITTRRSHSKLSLPAPDGTDIRTMLAAAMTAPDHKELRAWRFVVISGDARAELGRAMRSGLSQRVPDATQGQLQKEETKPFRAPVLIAVGAIAVDTNLPFVEIIASASAATQNLLLAAHALGYGAIWRTGASTRDADVKSWLGLNTQDEVVAVVYIGTPVGDTDARAPVPDQIVEWRG